MARIILIFCTTCYFLVKYVRKKTRFQYFPSSKDNKKRQNSDFQVKVPLTITTAQFFGIGRESANDSHKRSFSRFCEGPLQTRR